MTAFDDVTLDLVGAIAAVEGIEAHDLDYSLHDYVATDAIRELVEADTEDWKLTFEIPDHTVTVDGAGEIRIDGETVPESEAVRSKKSR
ncbi:HalOD1 output domain-containing protein [Halosimplex sp. J119]